MTNLAAGVVGFIDAAVQEKLTTNGAHYKPRNIVEKVVGDIDKSLPMLSEQLRARQVKGEMKSSIRTLLRIVCSSSVGNFNELTSMCEEHIPSSVENAKQKDDGTPKTKRSKDMAGYGQDGRLAEHMDRSLSILREQLGDSNGPITEG